MLDHVIVGQSFEGRLNYFSFKETEYDLKTTGKRLTGCVLLNTSGMELTPTAIQDLLDELEASRASRKRAWENLQEIRWVLKDSAGMKLQPTTKKTIDLEGRPIKDGARKAITDRQNALHELVHAISQYRKLSESKPLTLQGSDYARTVLELNKAIDHAEGLLLQ